ncbi:MAG: hypothetical protein HYR84_11205 [Planctomycetes bacterium]|nr:hypothetical protein [Planctomycetota bacterium]
MIIHDGEHSVKIEVVDRAASHLPARGDVKFSVAVSSHGFTGQAFAWVASTTLAAFMQELRELDRRRQGSASLEGMSPGEFHLCIWSIDRRGHLAIRGSIANQRREGESGPYRHSVEFNFEFDPTCLPKILAEFGEIVANSP